MTLIQLPNSMCIRGRQTPNVYGNDTGVCTSEPNYACSQDAKLQNTAMVARREEVVLLGEETALPPVVAR